MNAEGLICLARRIFSKLEEPINISVQRIISEGDTVVVEAQGSARTTRRGNYDNDYLFVFRVVGEKIVEAHEYLDAMKLFDLMEDRR